MSAHRRIFILGLMILLTLLSACGPDVGLLPPDPDGDDSGQNEDMSEQQISETAAEGTATVYYHYLMKHADVEFTLEPVIPLNIVAGTSPGSFELSGIGQIQAQMRIAASGQTYRCNYNCDITLNFTADGEIQLDENTGKCIIPISFSFIPQPDDWILETDCPDPAGATFDCTAMSILMADPSVYTFTNSKRDVKLPTEEGVTLMAEIKDVVMPSGADGICDW